MASSGCVGQLRPSEQGHLYHQKMARTLLSNQAHHHPWALNATSLTGR